MTLRSRRKPPITARNTRQTNSVAFQASLICLAVPLLALAVVEIAAPAQADDAVVQAAYTSGQSASSVVQVSYTVGESGHKFKWTPYRPGNPQKAEPLRADAAQYTAPSAAAGLHPLDDPFADEGQPAGKPTLPKIDQLLVDDGDRKAQAAKPLIQKEKSEDLPSLPPFKAGESEIGPIVQRPSGAIQECKYAPDDILRPISELNHETAIRLSQPLKPTTCELEGGDFVPRSWAPTTYLWQASGLCHKPAYFEDMHLERYGHSWGPYLQPVMSGAHFFLNVPILPYKMGLYPPGECVYTLGYYRPGSCAPYLLDPLPLSIRAGLAQAGAVVGFAAFLP